MPRRVRQAGVAMKAFFSRVVALSVTLAVPPAVARPTEDAEVGMPPAQATEAAPQPAEPSSLAPTEPPPPPPTENPAPPSDWMQNPPQQGVPPGQWVYTGQYGWVWMPYGSAYTYVSPDGAAPNMYVYTPTIGWCWVIAPWVWGWGPMPYFGIYGPWQFGWYGHGFGHWYGFRSGHARWYGGYWRGGHWNGYRGLTPAPPRGGFAPRGIVPRGGRMAPPRIGYAAPAHRGFAPPRHIAPPRGGPGAAPRGGFGRSAWAGPPGRSGGNHAGGMRPGRGHR